jgi:Ca-activated chloride channel homolog
MIKILIPTLFMAISLLPFAGVNGQSAEELYQTGEYQKAIDAWDGVVKERGENASVIYNQGNAYFKLGNTDKAQSNYEQALVGSDKTDLADIYYNLGNVRASQNEFKEALEFYKKALKHNPKDEDVKANIEMLNLMAKQQQQEQQSKDGEENKDQQEENDKSQDSQQNNSDEQNPDKSDQNEESLDKENQDQESQEDQSSAEQKDAKDESGDEKPQAQEAKESEEEKPEMQNALQILKQLENREIENMQKQARMKTKGKSLEKDW